MPILRKSAPPEPLIIAMAGVRLGDRVLILAGDDTELTIDVGAKVGLSGRTLVLSPTHDAAERVTARAERRGVLVESAAGPESLPHDADSFDLAIADDRRRTSNPLLSESIAGRLRSLLRPGGRLIVLVASPGGFRLPWQSQPRQPADTRGLEQRLLAAGFRAVRQVGTRDGTTFLEAKRS